MYFLENLTWREAQEAFTKCKTVIIPIGSVEQHGPHLPLGTDYFTAQFFSDALVKAKRDAIVAPVLPIGFADYHSDFPGTLSLRFETLVAAVTDICDKFISYGVKHILFFNCHGGNAAPLSRVCYDLRLKGVVAAVYMWFETVGNIKDEWKLIGHGDAGETSIVMAHRPGVCDPAKAARPAERHYSDSLKITEMNLLNFREIMPVHMAMRVKDVSETGAMLEPSLYPGADTGGWMENANPQTALEMRDAIVKLVVEFLPEFEKIEFDKI